MELKMHYLNIIVFILLFMVFSSYAQGQQVELVREDKVVKKYKKIQPAIDQARPGDVIRIYEGVYHEPLIIKDKNGESDKLITMEGVTGADVVIDVADPQLQKSGNGRWDHLGDGKYEASVEWSGDAWRALNTWVTTADETLLAAYALEHKLDDQIRGSGTIRGDGSFMDENKVKIKLEDGRNPDEIGLNIAVSPFGIEFTNSSYWKVKNITIKHAGFAGVFFSDAKSGHNTFDHVNVISSYRGFSTDDYNKGPDYLRFLHCRIKNDLNAAKGWDWREGYADDRDSPGHGGGSGTPFNAHGFMLFNSNYSEIAYCEIDGHWDGGLVYGDHTSIHHTIIKNTLDDAIELEGHGSEHFHFYNNLIYNTWAGISVAPDPIGPMYIYRNIVVASQEFLFYDKWQPGYCVKFGIRFHDYLTEDVKFYNNTFYAKNELIRVWNEDVYTEDFIGVEFVNNIFHIEEDVDGISDRYDPPCDSGNYFNNNLYNRGLSLEVMKEICEGWEAEGISGDAHFEHSGGEVPSLKILPTGSAVDRGTDYVEKMGWPDNIIVTDGKPDIGAHEYGVYFPDVGPK